MFTATLFNFRKLMLASTIIVIVAISAPQARPANPNKPGGSSGAQLPYSLVLIAPTGVPLANGGPQDVDDDGNVVGSYRTTDGQDWAYYYDLASNTFSTLTGGTAVVALNSRQEIVGRNVDHELVTSTALYWSSPVASPQVLVSLTPGGSAGAYDINDLGIVVGGSRDGAVHSAVIWQTGAQGVYGPAPLPPLPGHPHAGVAALSEFDNTGVARAVGYSALTVGGWGDVDGRATLWEISIGSDGALVVSEAVDLGVLNTGPSQAWGVNVVGDVCGHSDNGPFVKLDGQPMQPLPVTSRTIDSHANDISAARKVVGIVVEYTRFSGTMPKAWLWSAGQGYNLNGQVKLGRSEVLEVATAISNGGHIVGTGEFAQANAGYLLVPNSP